MAKEKSVRAQINELPVGQSVGFPLDRYDYAVNCKTRLQMGNDKRWTAKIDRPTNQVIITRIN